MDEKVLLNVEGMDCANCALSITRSLQKSGFKEVTVNFATGEVLFDVIEPVKVDEAVSNIKKLGYSVVKRSDQLNQQTELSLPGNSYTVTRNKFLIALLFTIPLFLHMFVHLNIYMTHIFN